ncbi:MAG: PaaI family thioesterase [Pararhodobacter sp.]|nr:PaaI family thioesterase [Pararhodobacter sp.]
MTSPLPPVPAHIQASFDRQSMMQTIGATLIAAGDGACVIRAPILAGMRQQHGAGHAGLAFTLGDTAAGYAALSLYPPDREVMTAEIKINLLSPAIGEMLEARGEVVRAGRRLSVVRAEVWALQGDKRKTIALMQGTMIPVDPA